VSIQRNRGLPLFLFPS